MGKWRSTLSEKKEAGGGGEWGEELVEFGPGKRVTFGM